MLEQILFTEENPSKLETLNQPIYEKTLKCHSDTISQVVFNPNNKQLISSSYDNSVLIWELNSNIQAKPKKLIGHKSVINDISVSPTGLMIASASSDETVRLWRINNTNEDTESLNLKFNSAPVKSVDFSCDSRLIVTGSDDKTVKIVNVNDRKVMANLNSHTNWVKSVRFSHDARLIASSSDDKTVKLWDVNTKTLMYNFTGVHNGVVNAVRFHADNSLIATACFDKKIRLFDVRSKQLVQVYDQHKKSVTSLAFHPNGNYLSSTSYDEGINIYDLRNGAILFTLSGHDGPTTCVNFSKYGDYFSTGGADGLVILWKSNLNVDSQFYDLPADNQTSVRPSSRCSSVVKRHIDNEVSYNKGNGNDNISISEDLSKVFEKMVFQLELVTNTFKTFENRLTKLEDMIDVIKTQTEDNVKVRNIDNQIKQIKKEFIYETDKLIELNGNNINEYSYNNSRQSNSIHEFDI